MIGKIKFKKDYFKVTEDIRNHHAIDQNVLPYTVRDTGGLETDVSVYSFAHLAVCVERESLPDRTNVLEAIGTLHDLRDYQKQLEKLTEGEMKISRC